MPGFNPLILDEGHTLELARRNVQSIIKSYHDSYDLFAEMAQNSVDAIERRMLHENDDFVGRISIKIDMPNNEFTMLDNGIGIPSEHFGGIFAPNYSIQTDDIRHRGHKGVGFTYVSYGFNRVQLSSKHETGTNSLELEGGRAWAKGDVALENCPLARVYEETDEDFLAQQKGTLVRVRLGEDTRPRTMHLLGGNRNLSENLERWKTIMLTKTAIGRVTETFNHQRPINLSILLITRDGNRLREADISSNFRLPAPIDSGLDSPYLNLNLIREGAIPGVGARYRNKSGMFKVLTHQELEDFCAFRNHEELIQIFRDNSVWAYVFMAHSHEFFTTEQSLRVRPNRGLSICTRSMVAVPVTALNLNRSVETAGYTSIMLHYDELDLDYGRKVVDPEVAELNQYLSNQIIKYMTSDRKRETYLIRADGGGGDADGNLDDWKYETREWSQNHPLLWRGESLPIVSIPRQEQEVVALFHGLVAAGHLRGWDVLAAAEGNRKYDSIMRHTPLIEYNQQEFPQGVRVTNENRGPLRVVEFKLSLITVLREFDSATENSKRFQDVDLLIAWNHGGFENGCHGAYYLETVSTPETNAERIYTGQTHILSREGETIPVILLEDLFDIANNGDDALTRQRGRYGQD